MNKEEKDIKAIFSEALEKQTTEEQVAYLDKACGNDTKLRARIEALLKAHEQAGDFLKSPAIEPDVTLDSPHQIEGLGTKIGRYELLQLIGEGGMGLVYLAQQTHPVRREGALKIIKPGMDSKEVIARFDAERQTLAVLDHPNIARVFDAGTTDTGRPYFVMEYVKGQPITKYCDEHKLNIEQRLKLFKEVCEGVHYAHQKGIIHRDIKPSNILISVHGDRAVPKIIDFGIAKATASALTEKTLYTHQGQLLGTPEYMSPEQVDLAIQDIDTRSDIYSLGVVLYELLAGVLPFERDSLQKLGFAELQRTIREQEPVTPSHKLSSLGEQAKTIAASRMTQVVPLARRLHRELEWVPLKAMRKDRCRRYKSAAEMADDIQNYLNGNPLIAGPETAIYRMRKFVKKYAGSVITVVLVAAAIVIGFIVSTVMYFQAEEARKNEVIARIEAEKARKNEVIARTRAEQAEKIAQERAEAYRRAMYSNNLAMAKEAVSEASINRADKLLNACEPELRGWEWQHLKYISDQSIATFHCHDECINSVSLSPDGRRIASASYDKTVKIWDTATGSEVMTLQHNDYVYAVVFSPDGRHIVSSGKEKVLKVWDAITGAEVMTLEGHKAEIWALNFSPNGKLIASGDDDGIIRLWNASTGAEIKTLTGHEEGISSVTFSRDGMRIFSGSSDHTIKVWDVNGGTELMTLKGHKGSVWPIVLSPDGTYIASGSPDKTIKIWDAISGAEVMTLRGHKEGIWGLAFSPDGKQLISSGGDKTIKVWDAVTGAEKRTLCGHNSGVCSIIFSRDGKRIFTADDGGLIKVWNPAVDREMFRLYGYKNIVRSVIFSPDGELIAAAGGGRVIKLWDTVSGAEIMTLRGHESAVSSIAFSPDGSQIVSGGYDKTVRVWNVVTGAMEMTLAGHKAMVTSVAFSPDGKQIAAGAANKIIKVWNATTGAEVMTLSGHGDSVYGPEYSLVTSITFSPDGKRIISGGYDQTVRIWDASSGALLLTLHGHRLFVYGVSVSPDGKRIASCGSDQTVRIWDAETGQELMILHGHDSVVYSVGFSPDSKRIISTGYGQGIKIWDADTGAELMNLYGDSNLHMSLVFSPDGKTICRAGSGDITLWESVEPDTGFESRQTAETARNVVEDLYEKHDFYYNVMAKVKENATISDPVRKLALQIASTRLWEDVEKLNEQSLKVLGSADSNETAYREALEKAEKAAGLEPDNWSILNTLGMAQYRVGSFENALATMNRAAQIRAVIHEEPELANTAYRVMSLYHLNRGNEAKAALNQLRDLYEMEWSEKRNKPRFMLVIETEKLLVSENERLCSIWEFIKDEKLDEAAKLLEEIDSSSNKDIGLSNAIKGAIKILSRLYYDSGKNRWGKSNDYKGMIADYENAIRVDPNYAQAFNNLSWVISTCYSEEFRNGHKAIELATQACELTDWKNFDYLSTLAAAYSEVSDFNNAAKWQKEAIELLPGDKHTELLSNYETRLELYQSGLSYCQGSRWSIYTGDLVAWWKMDEIKEDYILDSSGNDLHGKVVGDANIIADPERGKVLNLDGKSYIDCRNDEAFDITGSITIAVWIKAELDKQFSAIITKGDSAWRLSMWQDSNQVGMGYSGICGDSYGGNSRWAGLGGPSDVNDGNWHHVVGIYDGNEFRMYVDSKLDASKKAWGSADKNNYPVYIGENSEILNRQWKGLIDDVRIYSYALSQEEIKMLYEGKEPPHKKGL